MKKIYFLVVVFMGFQSLTAQIGIKNSNPDSAYALDVSGSAKIDGSLTLENPGSEAIFRNSQLLIKSSSNEILKYDINVSKYGPINYTEFVFQELSKNGLTDYDTKISTLEYIVTIQGFYFLEAGTGDTDIMTHSNINNDNIEGYQVYAYPNPATQTWFLRAVINNGTFRTRLSGTFLDTPIDLYLNLVIFRKRFIAKEQSDISVNLSASETGTAPLPTGF